MNVVIKNKVIKIDSEDEKFIKQYKWYFQNENLKAEYGNRKKRKHVSFKHLILKLDKYERVFFLNGEKNDYRKSNLTTKGKPIFIKNIVQIPLGNNRYAIIDKDDYVKAKEYSWSYSGTQKHGYAKANNKNGGWIYLHQLIPAFRSEQIDHINGNTLDNRKENLRPADAKKNSYNKKKYNGTSKYKGVSKNGDKWTAQITKNYLGQYLGMFDKEKDAAMAYDNMAKQHFGKFAKLNFGENLIMKVVTK